MRGVETWCADLSLWFWVPVTDAILPFTRARALPHADAYRRAIDVSPQDFRAWYGLVSERLCVSACVCVCVCVCVCACVCRCGALGARAAATGGSSRPPSCNTAVCAVPTCPHRSLCASVLLRAD